MRILFVVPYVPSLIRTRPYNLIRSLTARGHEVTVVTPWFVDSERQEAEALRAHCHRVIAVRLSRLRRSWNRLRAIGLLRPMQATLCWIPDLARSIERALLAPGGGVAFDAIHVEHLRAACYGTYLCSRLAQGSFQLPVIWDCVDCLHLLMERAVKSNKRVTVRLRHAYEALRMRSQEARLLDRFRWVLVTSPEDRDALISLALRHRSRKSADAAFAASSAGNSQVKVLPNGVDLDYFRESSDAPRESATLVLSGKMSYHANVAMVLHFVKEILPLVRAKRPEVRVCVAGKSPPLEIASLTRLPGISVTGTVPDLRPYLCRATVAVAPIRYGVGIQNKVLEAMACETPVVGSPQSISALTATPGKEVLVAVTAEEFAKHILNLLESPPRRQELGRAGRAYVEREHNWSQVASRLEQVYEEAIQSPSRAPCTDRFVSRWRLRSRVW